MLIDADARIGRANFGRRIIQLAKELEVRGPASQKSAEATIYKVATSETAGMVGWMKDLVLLAAEDILRPDNKDATTEDLRKALDQERQRSEDYRESALKKEAVIRGLRNEITQLETKLDAEQSTTGIVNETEWQALDLLREIVMSENGDLDSVLLKASRLVLRADETKRS
jgi:phage I-like protein